MDTTVTVTNPFRSRKFGFGYTSRVIDTPRGYQIDTPVAPQYTGTLNQLSRAVEDDRTLASFRNNTLHSCAWFYAGKRIVSVKGFEGPTGSDSFNAWQQEVDFRWYDSHTRPNSVTLILAA
jgi:hypothetical protein